MTHEKLTGYLSFLLQVNVPKQRRTFCKGKKCRKHTLHKVTQYKKGKDSLFAQGNIWHTFRTTRQIACRLPGVALPRARIHGRQCYWTHRHAKSWQNSGSGCKHLSKSRKYIALIGEKMRYYHSDDIFTMEYFPIHQRSTIMYVYNILIHRTTSHGSANGSTSYSCVLVFWFHKSCT